MNIMNIAIKEMKTSFRNPQTLFFALGLPVILILALGMMFTDSFQSTISVKNITVLYTEEPRHPFAKEFQALITEAKQMDVHFKKVENPKDRTKNVQQNTVGYVEIKQQGIHFYPNDTNHIGANMVQGMLTSFLDQVNLASATKSDPLTLMTLNVNDNYIQETFLNANKQPSAIDYFSVSMTTMIILFGAANAIHLINEERKRKTADRLIIAPISKLEIFLGKIFGSVVIHTFYFLVVILISKYLFDANWGDFLGIVIIVFISEVFLATSLGVIIGAITKSTKAANSVVQVIAVITTIFSGTFYKMDSMNGLFYLNPLNWVNEAIMNIIYAHDFSMAIVAISLNIMVSMLFLLITITLLHKKEGL